MCHFNLTGAQAPYLEDEMKRPLKNVQLRLDQTTFELLKEYKDKCGLANLSETIEKLVFYNLPLQEDKTDLTIEQDVPAPEDKTVTVRTTDQSFGSDDVLQVRDDVPIPDIRNANRESFSNIVENTLKKMKVGQSFLVKGENQRSISLGVGKKLKMTLATRQTPNFKKDKRIRVWRVA
jgi:hypothetical protein